MLVCEAVEPDGKSCSACGKYKSLTEFYVDKRNRDGRTGKCGKCLSASQKSWKQTNPEKTSIQQRRYRLKTAYGLTPADWEALWLAQEGLCGLCAKPLLRDGSTVVDHDHTTSRVRSLLHSRCNTGFGLFFEDPEILLNAVRYAEKNHALAAQP